MTPTGFIGAASVAQAVGLQVSASSDDVNQDGNALASNATTDWLGNGSSTSSSYFRFRFTHVAIPPGAAITSARLQVYSSQNQWIALSMSMAAEATGNSPTFTSSSKPSPRTLTTHYVKSRSNVRWTANTWYTLDEMAPVIQEVVNRSDWHSGNSLSIILKGTGSTWGRKWVTSFDGSAALAPKLLVSYVTSGGATGTAVSVPAVTLPVDALHASSP